MVIYTEPEMVSNITKMRKHAKGLTHIIPMQLSETKMAKEYTKEFWKKQWEIDPAGEKYPNKDGEIYIIYAEKTNFLNKVVEENPFNTSFFAWVDIGSFRYDKYNGETMLSVIPSDLKEDQVLLNDVSSLDSSQGVCGCFIGGYAKGIQRWNEKFYSVLDAGAKEGKFIGLDQPWMAKTCDKHPGLCKKVQPHRIKGSDMWFYMAPYLMGFTEYNRNNQSDINSE